MYPEYEDEKADWCLGCGAAITAGDGYLPFDDHWLLCVECAESQPGDERQASAWLRAVHV